MKPAITTFIVSIIATLATGLFTAQKYYTRGELSERGKWEVRRARDLAAFNESQRELDEQRSENERVTALNRSLTRALAQAQQVTPTETIYVELPPADCPVAVVATPQLVREYGSFLADHWRAELRRTGGTDGDAEPSA